MTAPRIWPLRQRRLLEAPHPLCGHAKEDLRPKGYRAKCRQCGSFWDMEALEVGGCRYDGDYPSTRYHHDPRVGATKVESLRMWLKRIGLSTRGQVICEVGFGGAHCIAWLYATGSSVYGLEPVPDNHANATLLGIPHDRMFLPGERPEVLPERIDLWLFLDSFEHLDEPSSLMAWIARNSAPDASILLVTPRAGSLSERLLGRAWIHKTPDHVFHWSRQGLLELFSRYAFLLDCQFYPVKMVSLKTVVSHLAHKLHIANDWRSRIVERMPSWSARCNFGEIGLFLRRS